MTEAITSYRAETSRLALTGPLGTRPLSLPAPPPPAARQARRRGLVVAANADWSALNDAVSGFGDEGAELETDGTVASMKLSEAHHGPSAYKLRKLHMLKERRKGMLRARDMLRATYGKKKMLYLRMGPGLANLATQLANADKAHRPKLQMALDGMRRDYIVLGREIKEIEQQLVLADKNLDDITAEIDLLSAI